MAPRARKNVTYGSFTCSRYSTTSLFSGSSATHCLILLAELMPHACISVKTFALRGGFGRTLQRRRRKLRKALGWADCSPTALSNARQVVSFENLTWWPILVPPSLVHVFQAIS
ncbi:hypothetical protein L202_00591 [Cryptococcus amylolentus CBS 6039]|uniref:Uncharacterized protein n=1 Tax=Cryptococcus amylolentus CBS 6039 TaxID=1295533 RepID=A0A1E3I7S5_9TREE|nr:hypothetical protein L202_00591 [Cryptococcus amylolentus CBS 6039]ODN84699.1 hypothetical protein L202_00591 [Cryptococcus amylolentus CBS 6039]